MKILIIESDDLIFHNMFYALTQITDCTIKRAESKNSGLYEFYKSVKDKQPYSLIFCDKYLPNYDGDYTTKLYSKAVVKEIRKDEKTHTPICIISNSESILAGEDYFLQLNNNNDYLLKLKDLFVTEGICTKSGAI